MHLTSANRTDSGFEIKWFLDMAPMDKFLGFWSLRTGSKTMAMAAIILLGISIYATRRIPEQFDDDKDWKLWRNLDFSVSVVSLLFVSFLLYGSISEFRLFVLAWIPWNVILIAFWKAFLIIKYDEMEEWERIFRIISIVLMAYAELVVYSYYKDVKDRVKDAESGMKWTQNEFDQDYKTLREQCSYSSIHSVFMSKSSADNFGFQRESNHSKISSSTASEASEEIEMREQQEETKSGMQTSADPEIATTAHPHNPESETAELQELPPEIAHDSIPPIVTPSQEVQISKANESGPGVSTRVTESEEVLSMIKQNVTAEFSAQADLAMALTDTTSTRQPDVESIKKVSAVAAEIEDNKIDAQNETKSTYEQSEPAVGSASPDKENARVQPDILHEEDKNRMQ